MKKKFLFVFIVLAQIVSAQEVSLPNNTSGANGSEVLRHVWKSSWISHPSASLSDYGVLLFRKKIKLKNIPAQLLVYVSGDNRYKLYVNGKFLGNGPARGDQLHWNYETIDIAPALKPGENILSAEVVNFGTARPVAQHTFQTAFLLQAADSMYDALNTLGGNWKVFYNNAYRPIPVTFAMVNGYYAAGPCDSVDAVKYPWLWKEVNFNDSGWLAAVPSNLAVGRGFIYGNPIHLMPRAIPFMERKTERFASIAKTDYPVSGGINFISGGPTVIPKRSFVHILLDMKYLTTGYPELSISGGQGSSIRIDYAEALLDKNGAKGNRNDIEGKHIEGYHDFYRLDGGSDRLFETLWQRTFRYVQLEIHTGGEDLVVNDFFNHFTAYPFVEQASFQSDLPVLGKVWDVAWRTARLCAGETYFDCPYYEQLQYVGDTRIQALISLYVSGDDRLMRNALELFDHSRISDGLTLSRYPSNLPQIIPPYSLMWINMVHDYYLYRGDSLFLSQYMQGIKDVLHWYESKTDSSGMLSNLEWWSFSDYTEGFPLGIPEEADRGNSALTTLQYVYALQHASELMNYFKDSTAANKYAQQAKAIQKNVVEKCFDPKRGLIAEGPDQKRFSLHTTLFAILTNTVAPGDQQALLQKVLLDKTLIQPSIYFRFYLFRCLQQVGMGDEYLNHLDTWTSMLREGLSTFAESDSNTRSDCHAWSASPLFDLLHLVAGIQPASPGFRSVLIEPNFGPLKLIDASFPHPKGKLTVHLAKNKQNKIAGYIDLPAGLGGVFRYRNKLLILKEGGKQEINL